MSMPPQLTFPPSPSRRTAATSSWSSSFWTTRRTRTSPPPPTACSYLLPLSRPSHFIRRDIGSDDVAESHTEATVSGVHLPPLTRWGGRNVAVSTTLGRGQSQCLRCGKTQGADGGTCQGCGAAMGQSRRDGGADQAGLTALHAVSRIAAGTREGGRGGGIK